MIIFYVIPLIEKDDNVLTIPLLQLTVFIFLINIRKYIRGNSSIYFFINYKLIVYIKNQKLIYTFIQ